MLGESSAQTRTVPSVFPKEEETHEIRKNVCAGGEHRGVYTALIHRFSSRLGDFESVRPRPQRAALHIGADVTRL